MVKRYGEPDMKKMQSIERGALMTRPRLWVVEVAQPRGDLRTVPS